MKQGCMRFPGWAIAAAWLCLANITAAHELAGTWVFEKEAHTRADGTPVAVPEPAYEGLLIYTADGFVSATVMPRDRTWQPANATLEELRGSVAEGAATAYAGRYQLDAKAHTVFHTPMVSLDPTDTGQRLARHYEVAGDVLKLSGKWHYHGEELTFTVYWRRARPEGR